MPLIGSFKPSREGVAMPKSIRVYGALVGMGLIAGAVIAVLGLPYGRLNYTAFAELYHGATDTTGLVHVAIDCEPSMSGTQDACVRDTSFGPLSTTVDVTIGNSTGASFVLAAFNATVLNPGQPLLDARTVNNTGSLDDNPDFNQAAIVGADWHCEAPPPTDDNPATSGPPEDSTIVCTNILGDGPAIASDPTHVTLFSVLYDIEGFTPGAVALSLSNVNIFDSTFTEVGSCNPINVTEARCFGATLTILSGIGCLDDHDCDGFKNPPPPGHLGPQNTNPDWDNCYVPPNSDQYNSDGNFIDQSPPYTTAADDKTRIMSDSPGDRCDADNDNDGLPDYRETDLAQLQILCPYATATLDRFNLDTDGDRVTDYAECAFGTDSADPASKPPASYPVANDTDRDTLTNYFEYNIGTDPNLKDTDGDGLQDGWEFKGYGSNPLAVDSDGDGIRDACEVGSINLDTIVNSGDQALLATEMVRAVPASQKLANMDMNKDGVLNSGDQTFQATLVGPGKCP